MFIYTATSLLRSSLERCFSYNAHTSWAPIFSTIFAIINSLKVGCVYTWTDQPASFPEMTKRDWSSAWRSASSTRTVVGLCNCCLTLTVCSRQVSTAALAHFNSLGTDVTVSCSPLPSRHLSGRVIMRNDCMHSQHSRDVRTRTFPWMRPWMYTDAFADASAHCWPYLCAFRVPFVDVNTTLHFKLRTLVSRYVSNCQRCRRQDCIPILCRCLRTVFLAEAKMFASAHLASAVVGINRNGCHREPISLLSSFRYNALFAWLPLWTL